MADLRKIGRNDVSENLAPKFHSKVEDPLLPLPPGKCTSGTYLLPYWS